MLLDVLMPRSSSQTCRRSVLCLCALPHAVSATNVKDTATLFKSALRSGVKIHSSFNTSLSIGRFMHVAHMFIGQVLQAFTRRALEFKRYKVDLPSFNRHHSLLHMCVCVCGGTGGPARAASGFNGDSV